VTPQTIAICNQKGGVGKTALTVGLADAYAERGKRVLVIDADPQANATTGLGLAETPPFTLNDVLAGHDGEVSPGVIGDAAVPAGEYWTHVDVVGSDLSLANRDQDQMVGRETRLRTALEGGTDRWDAVLIDCPPSLGQLTVNALVAADVALLVTEPRASSVDGLASIVRTIATVRRHFNERLRIAGVVVNKVRPRARDSSEWVETLRENYDTLLVDEFVPDREVISQAGSAAAPLSAYGARAREVREILDNVAERTLK